MKVSRIILAGLMSVFTSEALICRTSVNLQKAFDNHYIIAKALCTGGLTLNYSVTNLIIDSIFITIPAGWRFNSNGGKNDYQDILITRPELLVLKPNETKNFTIKGYCCEASMSGPVEGIPYTLGKLADTNLVNLARFLSLHATDQNTQQYAVWAVSDHKETAHITNKNDSVAGLIRNFVSGIKGEPLPWYTLLKRASVSSGGDVQDHPVRFKSEFTYVTPDTCYSYCYIVNSKGETVSGIFGRWLTAGSGQYHADFNVAALKKGDYKLVLESKKEFLFEKNFKI